MPTSRPAACRSRPEFARSAAPPIDSRRLPDRVRGHGLFLGGPAAGPGDTHFVRRTALQQLASGGARRVGRR